MEERSTKEEKKQMNTVLFSVDEIPESLVDGVKKVPKGCSEGFCHFWHLLTSGIPKFTLPCKSAKRRLIRQEKEQGFSSTPLALQENVSIGKMRLLGQETTTFGGCANSSFKGILLARGKE